MSAKSLAIGEVVDVQGTPCKVVGFRRQVRGDFVEPGTTKAKLYPVYVEQSGDYRLFTMGPKVVARDA